MDNICHRAYQDAIGCSNAGAPLSSTWGHYTKRQKSYANDFVDSLNNAAPAIVASASCMVEYPAAVIHIALCKLLGAPCILVLAY
jgi:hypothetical protein